MAKRRLLLYLIALIIRIIFALPFVHDWDGFVFSQSAKNLLKGETPYQTVVGKDPSIYPDSDMPSIQQWYAYPPLPLLMFTIPLSVAEIFRIPLSLTVETFLLKLPFIIGDLIAANLVRRLLKHKSKKSAEKAELLVLFNPLLIWISSAWGMFDIWMANFLMLVLLALRRSKMWQAGMFLAFACMTKLFPVFFLPVIMVYIFKNFKEKSKIIDLLLVFLFVLAVIVVPFFLSSPRGFLNQTILMHIQRSPQGLSIPALFDYYRNIYHLPDIPFTTIAAVLMYLTILTVFLNDLVRRSITEGKLICSMMTIYVSILMFNKVTNEQYFVLLIVFLIIILYSPAQPSNPFSSKLLSFTKVAATYGVLIAASLLGFHFLSFLLPEITLLQLKSSTNLMVFYLSRHFNLSLYVYPDSVWTYYNLPMTITSLVMLPFLVLGLIILSRAWHYILLSRKEIILEAFLILSRIKNIPKYTKLSVVVSIFLLLIFFPFLKTYVINNKLLTPISLLEKEDFGKLPQNPQIGVFYNVWWNNFSHYKDFPYGDWSKTTLTPLVGYYTSKNSYFVKHIKQMKKAGIDFALVSYHLYDRKRYLTFGRYAEKLGLFFVPLIETGDVLAFDKFRPIAPNGNRMLGFSLSRESKDALENVIISSLSDRTNNAAFLRRSGEPVVFLYDSHWFYPSWDKEFKILLSNRIVMRYSSNSSPNFSNLAKRWQLPIDSIEDVTVLYPKSIEGFNEKSIVANDFREAFLAEYKEFWNSLKDNVERVTGPIFLITTSTPLDPFSNKHFVIQPNDLIDIVSFNGEYYYSIANTWVIWRNGSQAEEIKKAWEKQTEQQVQRNINKKPLFLTVTAKYSDKFVRPKLGFEIPGEINGLNTYDWAWEVALKYNPDYILITSWNEFFEGTAIEPSKEHGPYYLWMTKKWADKFKSLK